MTPWRDNIWVPHDPEDVEDYIFDFTDWLDGEALDESEVEASGVDVEKISDTGGRVRFRVSSGEVGVNGRVDVKVTSDNGRAASRSLHFIVTDR